MDIVLTTQKIANNATLDIVLGILCKYTKKYARKQICKTEGFPLFINVIMEVFY